MKALYNSLPATIQLMPDGYSIYRFNIVEVEKEGHTTYECDEVIIYGNVTREKVTREVINLLWSTDIEQKLLNDFNAFKLGILDKSYETTYIEFLNDRKYVKEQIKKDIPE